MWMVATPYARGRPPKNRMGQSIQPSIVSTNRPLPFVAHIEHGDPAASESGRAVLVVRGSRATRSGHLSSWARSKFSLRARAGDARIVDREPRTSFSQPRYDRAERQRACPDRVKVRRTWSPPQQRLFEA